MKLICKDPTHAGEWILIYMLSGPIVGTVLFLPMGFLITQLFFPNSVISSSFDFAGIVFFFIFSFMFALPAACTGWLLFLCRKMISNSQQLLAYSLTGGVTTWLWSLWVWNMEVEVTLWGLLALVGWLSAFGIAFIFFDKPDR